MFTQRNSNMESIFVEFFLNNLIQRWRLDPQTFFIEFFFSKSGSGGFISMFKKDFSFENLEEKKKNMFCLVKEEEEEFVDYFKNYI